MLEDGESSAEYAEYIALRLAAVGVAYETSQGFLKPSDTQRLGRLQKALPILQNLIFKDLWVEDDAQVIELAIEAARDLCTVIHPVTLLATIYSMREHLGENW